MKPTLIFDLDGTLVDSFELAVKSANKLSNKYGFNKFENLDFWKQKPLKKIIKDNLQLSFLKLPFFVRDMKLLMKKEFPNLIFFEGLIPVLEKLNESYDLGILTSNSKTAVESVLKNNHIDFFKFIYSDSSLFGKHILLKKIIKKHKLNPDSVVYIGDEQRDIESCKKINLNVIAVSWGYDNKELLKKSNPNNIADFPEDLLNILKNAQK